MELKGKNILFIAPIFHDYHTLIIEKLEQMGASVTFAPERDYSIIFKIVNNFFNFFLKKKQANHYKSILETIGGKKFDYLFVIRGYMITSEFVNEFKALNPNAETIMYQWDSNRTNSYQDVIEYFDIVKSFDYEDCVKYKKVSYLPLFYTDDIIKSSPPTNYEYDFFFIGSYQPERYIGLVNFLQFIRSTSYSIKSFIFIPWMGLIKQRLKGCNIDSNLVSTVPMGRREYIKILNSSRIVVDMSEPRQTGLAMRVIEALALRKKVLTINKNIVNEPFYDSQNILIFDVDNPSVPSGFVETDFNGEASVLSVSEWLRKCFSV